MKKNKTVFSVDSVYMAAVNSRGIDVSITSPEVKTDLFLSLGRFNLSSTHTHDDVEMAIEPCHADIRVIGIKVNVERFMGGDWMRL